MRYRLFIFVFLLIPAIGVFCQSAKQADDLFNAHDYAGARTIYESLLRKQPNQPLYLYRAARCAQEVGDLAAAEEWFVKAGTKYPLRDFFLGEIYYEQWRMAEAIAAYEAFLPSINEQHERYPIVQQRIASAQLIARYLKHVSRVEVLNVKRIAKSDLLQAYAISEDNGILHIDSSTCCFTTQRGDQRYYSVQATDTTDSVPLTRTMLVSQQKLLEHWEEPDTLRGTLSYGNTNNYPFVLTDGATLYFASDREGGLGGLDIYMTRYNASIGQWLPAENIGMPFNSPADDYLYALDEPNGYAYFATDRHCTGTDSVEVYRIATGERTFLRGLPDNELVALARLDSLIPILTADNQPFSEAAENAPYDILSRAIVEATSIQSPSNTASAAVSATDAKDVAQDSIFFVINDDLAYTHLSDFHNDSARTLYEQYIELEQIQSQAIDMLDSLRHQYYDANDATRASLKARIPILSSEISERKRTLRETLTQIRILETAQ